MIDFPFTARELASWPNTGIFFSGIPFYQIVSFVPPTNTVQKEWVIGGQDKLPIGYKYKSIPKPMGKISMREEDLVAFMELVLPFTGILSGFNFPDLFASKLLIAKVIVSESLRVVQVWSGVLVETHTPPEMLVNAREYVHELQLFFPNKPTSIQIPLTTEMLS